MAVSSVSKSDEKKAHSNKQWQRQNTAFCRPRLFRYQLVSCLWKSPPLFPCYQDFLFFFSLSCGGIRRLTSGLKMKILVMYTESARKSLPLSLSVERRSEEMYIQKRNSVIHIALLASAVSAATMTAFYYACGSFCRRKK